MSNTNNDKIGAVVIDFDNTITKVDVCDQIMNRFSTNWREAGASHDSGDISHSELNRRFVGLLDAEPKEVEDYLKGESFLRPGFQEFLNDLDDQNIPVFILSGGWDLYIRQILQNELPERKFCFSSDAPSLNNDGTRIFCNEVFFDKGKWNIKQPETKSFLASRDKVKVLGEIEEETSGAIIYFGDGSTDFEAASKATHVFARGSLKQYCKQSNIPYSSFEDFSDLNALRLNKALPSQSSQTTLDFLRANFFFAPDGSNAPSLGAVMTNVLTSVVENHGDGPTFPELRKRESSNEIIRKAEIADEFNRKPEDFLREEIPMGLQYGVKGGHPLMVKNIIPTPSSIFIAAHAIASIYAQNGVTGEDAGEALNSELKISAVISDMAGYDRFKSAGIFTFGGTATNMYGIKMGLAKCQPRNNLDGVNENICIIGSKPAHYSHVSATDWLGIGQNNYIYANSHVDQTTDLADLEKKCQEAIEAGKIIGCIIGVAGTTSNMAIDDFKEISDMRDRLVTKYNLDYIPHVHADSVVGWPYLYFSNYDFVKNPLSFSENALDRINQATKKITSVCYADSFGVDFHKTGFMPYNTSMVICKDKEDLKALGRDGELMTPLFHEEDVYNPGKITLETSRSSATMLATWVTMQSLGKNGYRALLGHAQEMALEVERNIAQDNESGLFVANKNGYGTDVFVRCYPPEISMQETFTSEMYDDAVLKKYSDYTSSFFKWLSDKNNPFSKKLAISKTSAAFYTPTGKPYVALRLYMLSPYTTKETVEDLVKILKTSKQHFDQLGKTNEPKPNRFEI